MNEATDCISWMDPHYEFSRTGNLSEINQEDNELKDKYSMQLTTSSLDGSLMIWDLKKKPTINPGGYKPKKLRRLKKRPSALELEVSPYRALHLNLKPIYKINVTRADNKNKPMAITRCSAAFCWLKYEETKHERMKKFDIKERVIYKPIMKPTRPLEEMLTVMKIGTTEGDFAEIRWDGQDFDSGETVNAEQARFIQTAKYHDGPLVAIHTSKSNGSTLTVGGKIFCIWRKDFSGRPILWRRSRQIFTKGEFSFFQSYKLIFQTISGEIQKWIIPINSKGPIFQQVMSNGFLTAAGAHPFNRVKNIYGIGDEQGAFRLFYLCTESVMNLEAEVNSMNNFVDREVKRKTLFLKWQEEFNKKNEKYLMRLKLEAEQKAKEEAEREALKEEDKLLEKPVKKGPQPGNYVEWIKEQRQLKEEARIKAMIINKKQLDTKELEKRRKPLQKLDEENERKKRKQKERLKQGENIFKETVASLFPDVIKEKPVPPPDPYAGGDPLDKKEDCFQQFLEIAEESDDFIFEHPFQYDFSFKNLLVDNECSKRWGYVRDYYIRRRGKPGTGSSGEAAKRRSKQLAFLDNFPSVKRITFNNIEQCESQKNKEISTADISQDESSMDQERSELLTDEETTNIISDTQEPRPDVVRTPIAKRKYAPNCTPADENLKILEQDREKVKTEKEDENDLFFKSMAQIVKNLPKIVQARLRMQVGNLVGNAEIEHFSMQTLEYRQSPAATSTTSNITIYTEDQSLKFNHATEDETDIKPHIFYPGSNNTY